MDLVKAIRDALDACVDHFKDEPYSSTGWTDEIHRRIGNLAPDYARGQGIHCGLPTGIAPGGKRLMVHTAGRNRPARPAIDGQFLFDQCWLVGYDNSADPDIDGYTSRCILAMESEWSLDPEEINRDFLKLVCAKADVKVMVCLAKSDTAKTAHQLTSQVALFEQKMSQPETYVFSIFSATEQKFHHHVSEIGRGLQ